MLNVLAQFCAGRKFQLPLGANLNRLWETIMADLNITGATAKAKSIYGVRIAGASMEPRYLQAEVVLVDPNRPPAIGDDVIVRLRDSGAILVKRLLRLNSEFVELTQYSPARTLRVGLDKVNAMHRILRLQDVIEAA
jgi:phage repressor protein C with HTH and peptisase S24 domain